MMLDFYGFSLLNNVTGEIGRSTNYASRFQNLNTNTHNHLRISRILKSLGELGFEHFKWPFLATVSREIYENGQIQSARTSLREYWSESLRNVGVESHLFAPAHHRPPPDHRTGLNARNRETK